MSFTILEVLFIFSLIVANGIFSMSELAVVSARKARLQRWAAEGSKNAKVALELAESPSNFLSTIQIGITLVGILSGAFGGATIAEDIGIALSRVPYLAPHADAIGLAVVVVCITYLTLIIGELVPKRIALDRAEQIACMTARPMRWLSQIGAPLVHLLTHSTEFVVQLLRIRPPSEPQITEQELHVLVEEGKQAGVFHSSEQAMVRGVFRLDETRVAALMTPVRDLVLIDKSDTPEKVLETVTTHNHARFPVMEGTRDNITGVVSAREILLAWLKDKKFTLENLIHQPLFVPESKTALELLEEFKHAQKSIALVFDEYGSFVGMATSSDIVNAVIGAIPGEEPAKWQATRRADGSWLLDAMIPIDKFKEIFSLTENLPGEAEEAYETLGGFVLYELDHLPSVAEKLMWRDLTLEVIDMDGYRIDKVLVYRQSEGEQASS